MVLRTVTVQWCTLETVISCMNKMQSETADYAPGAAI